MMDSDLIQAVGTVITTHETRPPASSGGNLLSRLLRLTLQQAEIRQVLRNRGRAHLPLKEEVIVIDEVQIHQTATSGLVGRIIDIEA